MTKTPSTSTRFKPNKKQQFQLLKLIVHIFALFPLVMLYAEWWQYHIGPGCVDDLSPLCANWIRYITLETGEHALRLLLLSLACTPAAILLGWKIVVPLRKHLGLYAFLYVTLHFLIFVGIDYGFRLDWILEELTMRRYAIAGFSAFLLLIPLALTSTNWAMRKMGQRWGQLHKLVYPAGVLATVHYVWLVKENYTEPLLYMGVLIFLLGVRLPPVRQWIKRMRDKG